MDLGKELGQILDRYKGAGGGTASAPADVHSDFQKVAQSAPQEHVAEGISNAMRSDKTPSFGESAANLFGQSNPEQRAGLLNKLIGSVGPQAASAIPGLGSLAGMIGGGRQITPEQASQVKPEEVQQLASHAEKSNPSVVDEVSRFYSQHPGVVKALGGVAVAMVIQHIAHKR